MFGGKDEVKAKTVLNSTTLIAVGTKIVGDLHFSGNLNLEGEVEGSIKATDENSTVKISQQGMVLGDIECPNILINGKVDGNVYSSNFLELSANADVHGDLYYREMETEKGSRINGRLIFQQTKKQEQDSAKPTLVESSKSANVS